MQKYIAANLLLSIVSIGRGFAYALCSPRAIIMSSHQRRIAFIIQNNIVCLFIITLNSVNHTLNKVLLDSNISYPLTSTNTSTLSIVNPIGLSSNPFSIATFSNSLVKSSSTTTSNPPLVWGSASTLRCLSEISPIL